MRFLIPKGTKIKRGHDIDYWVIGIGFGSRKHREWMQIGGGPNWSSGLPFIRDMTSAIEISERDMACGPNGISIQGLTKEGRWRFTGMGSRQWGETISYKNASEEAAKFFDSIIDGLHCDQEGIPGFGSLRSKR